MKKFAALVFTLALVIGLMAIPAQAATEEEIEGAIETGVAWLVDQQDPVDGSWGEFATVAMTGLAVVKLEHRAFELDYESPFDPAYEYSENVIAGLDYIFDQAASGPCGTYIATDSWYATYETGIAMMAIAAGGDMDRVVNVPGSVVDGLTYGEVLEANVAYFANSQTAEGGWAYACGEEWADNSNSGYAVLGLRYAETAGIDIPQTLKDKLSGWIDLLQDPVDGDADDGGSWYRTGWSWVNLLKTGNLLFEMEFVGDTAATQRVTDAIDYIERHWNDPNWDPGWRPDNYQAMYCLMKGLESFNIQALEVGGSPIDWYDEFADAIIATQIQPDGYWMDWYYLPPPIGSAVIGTEWALLTLERVVPPIEVQIDIKPGSYPNSINPNSKGVIPVAILTTSTAAGEPIDFDATTVDAETVRFGPGEATAVHYALEDVDGDGDIDMILHFKTRDTDIQPCDTEASLYGETVDGHKFIGTDSVRIVPPKAVKPPCLTVVDIQQPSQVAPCDMLTVAVEVHNQGCKPGECEVTLWVEDETGNPLVGPVTAPTGVVDPCETVTIPFGPWHVDETWVPGVNVVAVSCCGDPISCPIEVVPLPVVPQPSSTWTYEVTYVDPICGYGPEVTQWTIHVVELSVAPIPDLLPECVLVPIPPGPASHVYIDTTQGGTMPPPQRFNVGCEPFTILGVDGYLSDVDGTNQYIYLNCASYLGVFQLEVEASYVNYILLSGTNVGQPYAVGNSWQYDQYLEVFTPIFLCAGFGSSTVTVIVVAENQTVTVPAGTFTDCYEIQTLTPTGIKTDWWSPTVQGVVKTVDQWVTYPGNETWELLSYSLVY